MIDRINNNVQQVYSAYVDVEIDDSNYLKILLSYIPTFFTRIRFRGQQDRTRVSTQDSVVWKGIGNDVISGWNCGKTAFTTISMESHLWAHCLLAYHSHNGFGELGNVRLSDFSSLSIHIYFPWWSSLVVSLQTAPLQLLFIFVLNPFSSFLFSISPLWLDSQLGRYHFLPHREPVFVGFQLWRPAGPMRTVSQARRSSLASSWPWGMNRLKEAQKSIHDYRPFHMLLLFLPFSSMVNSFFQASYSTGRFSDGFRLSTN